MARFVVQGKNPDPLARSVADLGGTIDDTLDTLGRLSESAIANITVPDGVTADDLEATEGISIAEGRFLHPFYGIIRQVTADVRAPKGLPYPLINPVPPDDAIAVGIQWLPPPVYRALPTGRILADVLDTRLGQAEALQFGEEEAREFPFGVPGLSLGPPASEEAGRRSLGEILAAMRVPEAQERALGRDQIIAVIDSGIPSSVIPQANRGMGWSWDGSDPWTDPSGHGGMVAGIAHAVAPEATIASFKVVSPGLSMDSLGTLSAFDQVAKLALETRKTVIVNSSFCIFGIKNLILPCMIFLTRASRLLDSLGLIQACWAAGNNRHLVGDFGVSAYCMATVGWVTTVGALGRDLRPTFYTSKSGQCSPWKPDVAAPTYGVLPWGDGWRDFGDQGGGTSSTAPMVSGILALLKESWPDLTSPQLRAVLRAGASNLRIGAPIPYHPLTGSGLANAEASLGGFSPQASVWAGIERSISTSVERLGDEPELR